MLPEHMVASDPKVPVKLRYSAFFNLIREEKNKIREEKKRRRRRAGVGVD